jgi:hypothetical protein
LAGLPKAIASPGPNVKRSERNETISAGLNSICAVDASCLVSLLIVVSISMAVSVGSTSVSIHGPSGADPSQAFRAVRPG